ncbi:MAG: alpha-glucosidase C-terminal domain-containing protein [Chloroflexi bacterium]|nr:alpha-glucosidase C-terminal domain-containing protein [Chloroflexota bacterium]
MIPYWLYNAVIYHIYPLGLCDAPRQNDFCSPPVPRLECLHAWLDHIHSLNANTLYLGPVFESTAHGYDTANYYQVDRRLGDNATLKQFTGNLKSRGMRLILDGVFNHVGRDFWAFKDVLQKRQQSAYQDWFYRLNFDGNSPYNDGFSYEGWAGHYDLVKLNLHHPAVRQHLFDAITMWEHEFDIDGLRLDAADHLDHDFLRALASHCRQLKPDFWLMGEVVHGDYRKWANPEMLDATTNYECYKGLYSSLVDKNYFEIAYSLNRLFGSEGLYKDLMLYSFADNHDVNRVASNLTKTSHLYPLYILLFTMPGTPSIYYGSEWGIEGSRTNSDDYQLRPALDLGGKNKPHPDLLKAIRSLAHLRRELPALGCGTYRQLQVNHEQFAFMRETADQKLVVAVNASDHSTTVKVATLGGYSRLRDILNQGRITPIKGGQAEISLYPNWGSIYVVE